MRKAVLSIVAGCLLVSVAAQAQTSRKSLAELQQEFVDLRFGMFIHFNIPTFMDDDWADPDASPSIFNPVKLDCSQWAKTAKAANMRYGCLTAKHHSGFCIWDTKTTDYSVNNSPFKRDAVKEYVDAFRKEGLEVMLYYSILDTHHKLRPGFIAPHHIELVKNQLTELLTNYGEIKAIIIDGWDAPWSRISYDEIPFEDIYLLVKSLQPNCLLMDLNAAKYPAEALFYTDIKSYEQGAGQHISKESNRLPALSCLPINAAWFWKPDFPASPVKSPESLVRDNIVPLNEVYCNFILNAAPNRDGLIDDNAVSAFREIGKMWQHKGKMKPLQSREIPIISSNIAKHKPVNSSWSDDASIMDFANDDRFTTSWHSNRSVKQPWMEILLGNSEQPFNMITIVQGHNAIRKYRFEYFHNNKWQPLLTAGNDNPIKIHRFETVWANKVRIVIDEFTKSPAIAEFGVYNEKPEFGESNTQSRIKIALNLYSFNKPLTDGSETIESVIDYCSEAGFAAIDATGYYFKGYPETPSDEYINSLKYHAFRKGIQFAGTGVRNDFTLADAEARAKEKQLVKDWIVVAAKLGASTLRIFAGNGVASEGQEWDEMAHRVAESIDECGEFAKQYGVTLALQNHNDFLKTAEEVEKLFSMIHTDAVGLMLDIGSYRTDPYRETAQTIRHAVSWQIKENVFINNVETPTDISRIMDIIGKNDYRGYVPIETLGSGNERERVKEMLERIRKATNN